MVFVGQIKAAGVGLTLTKAEIVIMNSLDWVPGTHEQAEDRAYRIGQKETVNIYYMLMDKTIDKSRDRASDWIQTNPKPTLTYSSSFFCNCDDDNKI